MGKLHRLAWFRRSVRRTRFRRRATGSPRRCPACPASRSTAASAHRTRPTFNVRADAPDKFILSIVPILRFVAQATPGWRSVNSLAGGASEDLGGRFEQNLLRRWLTNDTYPVRMYPQDLIGAVDSVTVFVPKR